MSNQEQTSTTREKKRAQFSDQQPKSKGTLILVLILVALVAIAAYLVLNSAEEQPASTTVAGTGGPSQAGTDLRIPLSDVAGQAKFFDYKTADNRSVRFFVMKSSDGVYRAALDACDTCYHAKKGYHQQGEEMVCNNCGLRFHSTRINEVSGGCNPIGLPRQIDGDALVIKASELENRSRYF